MFKKYIPDVHGTIKYENKISQLYSCLKFREVKYSNIRVYILYIEFTLFSMTVIILNKRSGESGLGWNSIDRFVETFLTAIFNHDHDTGG